MSYGDDPNDGVTIALPRCDEHPPLRGWPMVNLIRGNCPACGAYYEVGESKTVRELRARRLIEERGL